MAPLEMLTTHSSANSRTTTVAQRQKMRSARIPVQNGVPAPMPANDPPLGTLIVSLPSGQLFDIQGCSETIKLGEFMSPGDNLLHRLDGKGAKLLTLQAFGGTPKARMFARLKLGQTSRPCSFLCEFVVDPENTANRIATIRVFEIRFATQPERPCDEFITRHNAGCNLIYFDAASVPYLSHFPSEKTGSSLFSVIHAEDAHLLQDVHRELRTGVKLARSTGIRFIAHDGRVWSVNSEWACFINPWSDHVEMVVAKHRLIEMVGQVKPSEVLLSEEQCRQNDQLVRSILENPPEFTLNKNDKLVNENLLASGAVSPPLTKNSEDLTQAQSPDLLLSYNQINCLENVHRLLKSQTNESAQKQDGQIPSTTSNQVVPQLTRELLHQHDRKWEENCKGKWHKRLQMKRAVSSSNASTTHDVPLKVARTEPTSPSAIATSNTSATSLFLSLLIEQQRRFQQQQSSNGGQFPMVAASALSNLLTQHATSGTSTPSNL